MKYGFKLLSFSGIYEEQDPCFPTEEEAINAALDAIKASNRDHLLYQITQKGNVYEVPFAYERYGRIEVSADSEAEAIKKAHAELEKMTVADMDANSTYLEDSEEIDEEGHIICRGEEMIA